MEIKGFSQCIAANKQQACGLAAAASCGMVAACEFFRMQISFAALSCSNLAVLSCSNLAALSCSNLAALSWQQPRDLLFAATLRLLRFSYANKISRS